MNLIGVVRSDMSDSEVYEVEAIVGHRRRKGKMYFRIRWVGYPPEDDTWEEEGNLMCPELVQDYLDKQVVDDDRKDAAASRSFPVEEIKEKGHAFYPKGSGRACPPFETEETRTPRYPLVEILDTITHEGEVFYLIKRKSIATEAVSSEEMRKRYPGQLVKFLEERMFEPSSEEEA